MTDPDATDPDAMDDYEGLDRREGERRINNLDLASKAAEIAARKVSRVQTRRVLVVCLLGAVALSSLIMVGVVVTLDRSRAHDALQNSRFNCRQWNAGARALRDFVVSDAQLRREQERLGRRVEIITGFDKIFGKGVVDDLMARSHALDRAAQVYWLYGTPASPATKTHPAVKARSGIVPRLQALAGVNCARVITTSGVKTTRVTVKALTVEVPGGG